MKEPNLYSINPPYRERGTVVRPLPEFRVTQGFANVPGYFDKMREVRCGRREPFWGTAYTLDGPGAPPDFVSAYAGQHGVSEQLRRILIDAKVAGLHFYPICVDNETTMYLVGVQGVVDIQPIPMQLRLMNGAEVGLYREANLYVSDRLATLIRNAGLEVALEEPMLAPD